MEPGRAGNSPRDRVPATCGTSLEEIPVRVPATRFAEFQRWLEGELSALTDQWAHAAAPAARVALPSRGTMSPSGFLSE